MKPASDNDKRRFSRISFDAEVHLILGSDEYSAHLLDIALKGALVELRQPAVDLAGRICKLRLNLGKDGESIVMDGMVAHQEGQHIGIKCTQMDVDSLTNLRRLVELNLGDETLLHRELFRLFGSK